MKINPRRRPIVLLILLGAAGVLGWWRQSERPVRTVAVAVGETVAARPVATPAGVAVDAVARAAMAPAAGQANRELFFFEQPQQADALNRALPAPARAVFYVRLNAALIGGKQSPFWQKAGEGRLEIPLPGRAALHVTITETTSLGVDRFTSVGVIDGRPGSRVIFAHNEGFLHATVEDVALGTFVLRAATAEWSQFYEVDPALVPACGAASKRVIGAAELGRELRRKQAAAEAERAAGGPADPPATTAASAGAGVTVQVMMLYTQGVLTTMAGTARVAALQSAFDAAIATANSDFANSQIAARVQLVKIAESAYADDQLASAVSGWQAAMLTALADPNDQKMDEIHALRDAAGADLVCLIANRPDAASAGIAYVLDTPGTNTNALYGFSVVGYGYLGAEHVFSHELGHNLGCAHARGDPGATGTKDGAYTYSYGYRFFGQDGRRYRDIMAYDPGTRVPYFSNPDVIVPAPISAPVGFTVNLAGEAHNARTINQSAFEVAGYRLQTQTASNTGTLINVATRAFSGAGERQLIGGFVIQGSAPKKMLLRASGPAIAAAPFGVPGTLADPRLTLYTTDTSPPRKLGENDNWGTALGGAAGPAEIAAAAALVGAFPWAAGSRDAALLATLAPGSYTVNVESADGGTGIALVEAYEADRNGNKVFNLSTRGYVDRDRPMIGGFVVQAGAGPTKRILIRVQGPSLAKFGLNAMNDPVLEIYNSAGDLVMTNDDWSTGAESVNGVRDDFRPTVTLYNERQIFATGFAPGNRREPCIMADLASGSYTALVRPFERLPDQVANPGVAIVEVYEINPK